MKKMVCFALFAIACGDGAGSLSVTVSGEEAAVSGWPAGEGEDRIAFIDGWTMQFETLTVSLDAFALRGADGDDALLSSDPILVDLHRGDALAWSFEAVPARRWEDVRFRVVPAQAAVRDVGQIDPAVRARMIDEGLSIYLEATAQKGELVRRIEWGFTSAVESSRCAGADGTDGLVIPRGGARETQVTLHWDHLFFDSLALDAANMRFDAIAALREDDAPIALADLSAQRLADLRDASGETLRDEDGSPIVYDPGSTPLSEPTLRGLIEAVVLTVGHFEGEGHCDYAPL